MTKLIACALFAFTACHHDAPQTTTTPTTTTTTAMSGEAANDQVDPTLPSWAPRSCKRYHATVVKLAACTDMDGTVRERVSKKYDSDLHTWQGLTNQTQADFDQIGTMCGDEVASLTAQMSGKCQNVVQSAER